MPFSQRLNLTIALMGVIIALAADSVAQDLAKVEWSQTILPKPPTELPAPHEFAVTQRVHALILEKAKEEKFESYQEPVQKAENKPLKMLPIPGGEFLMGSPPSEKNRKDDEGPQKTVAISPFWMSETEITWAHYDPFWQNDPEFVHPRNKDGTLDSDNDRYTSEVPTKETPLVDAISQPTIQYLDDFQSGLFEKGDDYPVMNGTNHTAAKFCQWLSAQTGHFYRLPTEAEWEYACRAGTTSAYSFGDDASKLSDYAHFAEWSDFTYAKVRQKVPNAWGLYDMHGNVAEWTIDGYSKGSLKSIPNNCRDPWFFPTTRYPRTIRGGSWDDVADGLRSAARVASSKELKMQDAQLPKSLWYHTNAQHVGFRVVRPVKIPSAEEMHLFWNSDFLSYERTQEDL